MDLGEIVRVRVRLITPERWYWITFERWVRPEDTEFFPILLEDKGDETIRATYPDMTKEIFSGIDEICRRFNLKIFHFENEGESN